MPVLKHAKKKLRQDVKRTRENKRIRTIYKNLLKKAKTSGTPKNIAEAFSAIDKAAKQNIIHKNKAARLKSSLSKGTGETKTTPTKTKTKTAKKPAAKKSTAKKTATKKS